jgi:hypothetical protein
MGGGCRKFESFVGNLGGSAPPATGKSEFPPLRGIYIKAVGSKSILAGLKNSKSEYILSEFINMNCFRTFLLLLCVLLIQI